MTAEPAASAPQPRHRATWSNSSYLTAAYPEVAETWCHAHNVDLDIRTVASQSKTIACWVCPTGHHVNAPIYRKTTGKAGCSVCANKTLLVGFNDMATVRPWLVKEWDFTANGDVKPSDLFPGSPYLAHWMCPSGHRYIAKVNNRATGQMSGCGICSNQVVAPGINDLKSQMPSLMEEWDWEAENPDPSTISIRSKAQVNWVCQLGHRWRTAVGKRSGRGQGCPFCSNTRLLEGFNDLATVSPSLAAEWDFSRNDKPPSQYLAGSAFKVWWKCSSGHIWKTTLDKRMAGRGCERCQKRATSLVEQALFQAFKDAPSISNASGGTVSLPIPWRTRNYMRVDMSGRHDVAGPVVIEYDGSYYHQDDASVRRDEDKTMALLGAGYHVIRIRENDLLHLKIAHPMFSQTSHRYGVDDPVVTIKRVLSLLPQPGSSKFLKAQELGIRIVTPDEFAQMIEDGEV